MRLTDYVNLFPGASREKPRFMALAELAETLPTGFAAGQAEGKQLDAVAEALGIRRATGATDETFRQYLLAKLAHGPGTARTKTSRPRFPRSRGSR